MERRDAGVLACDLASNGDAKGLIDGDQKDENDERDGLERSRRDLEASCELGVHDTSLLDGKGLELGQYCVEDDGAGKDGDDTDDYLHLFNLRSGA